jgi:hypothetical protein
VVEPDPVSDFVGEGVAEVEVLGGAAGEGGVEDDDAVVFGGILVLAGEGRVAEETLGVLVFESIFVLRRMVRLEGVRNADHYAPNGVHVKIESPALPQRVLHRGLVLTTHNRRD